MSDPAEADRELRGAAAGSALELVEHAYLATECDLSDSIEEFTLDYALDVKDYIKAARRAATEAEQQLDQFIATQLEGVQYYRHRDSIIRPGRGGTWKVTNPEGLKAWLDFHEAWHLVNLSAPGSITKTRLEEYYTLDADEESKETLEAAKKRIVNTFMERVPSGGPITVLRLEDAPKKAQALSEGESIAAKPRLEAKE